VEDFKADVLVFNVYFYIQCIYMASFKQLITARQSVNTEGIEMNTENIDSLFRTTGEHTETLSSL
jgi:hypothetical protein